MKKPCITVVGAVSPSPHAVKEVVLSDVAYILKVSEVEGKASCWDHLLGKRLREILTPNSHYNTDPDIAVVTPEEDEFASFTGVKRSVLQLTRT